MGSGCCGSPPAPVTEPPAAPTAASSDATSSCQDACCDGNDGDAAPLETSEPGQAAVPLDDNCCSSGKCADDDSEEESDVPDCCPDTTAPCCDTSCLDRLALRECSMSEHLPPKEDAQAIAFEGPADGKACNRHLTSALDRYGATLQALGCLCRSLIALGQETCCEIRERHSLSSAISSPSIEKQSSRSLARNHPDSYCSTGPATPSQAAQNRLRLRKTCGQRVASATKPSADACAGSCCPKDKPFNAPSVKEDGCQVSCADACCSSSATAAPVVDKLPTQTISDVEKQGAGKEHVVLSVSGMTCTGCETKLNRTLATVPAVRDLKTSLVLSRAEFDIDLRLGSVEEVVKHLERTTEFKCERIRSQGASLDLIVPGDPAYFMSQTWPEGVIDMALVGRQTVRVAFDAKTVGARHLVEKIWGPPVELAPPRGDTALEAGSKHVRHVGYMTLVSAILTIPVLVLAWAPLPARRELAYSAASLALATIVQVVIAGPFYPKALKALVFSRVIEMDLLIVLSTSAAYIFSVISFGYFVAGNPLSTGQFFETSTLLVTLIMVGRWVAALARQKAIESISIRSLQGPTAIIFDKERGGEREIDARLLQYGDTFKVLPDTRVPTDGTVLIGSSEIDESMLTGESRPVEKYPKSVVIAGSINGPGVMTVRLTRLPGDNTIHAIAAMVDEAKLSKPKLQDLADQVASYFVPVVVALTIITFVIWIAVGVAVRGQGAAKAIVEAITYAITVLIVSCPCAIGLAVPMVIVIASGVAAERGIIFKSATAIEVAHKTSHVVFDKTGTLTRGNLAVVGNECIDDEALPLLLGLVENSRHPVSVAVAAHLRGTGVTRVTVPEPKSLTGKGIESTLSGRKLQAGNSRWLGQSDNELVQPLLTQGCTVLCFAIDNEVKAVYGLKDELRPDAAKTVETLQERGVSVHVVSGDDDGAVRTLASKLRIPAENVRSRSSPANKKDYIQTLLGTVTGRKQPVVVFCGDGTNDAVALAQATIGVHMNEGTDVAQSAADVVLMRPSLSGVLTMINASRKSVHRIWFNFGWSFVYNTFAVLLAAGAFVNARIPPEFAGLGELVSVLPVIAAAVLLRWSKI
ncbi:uncharacterized protein J7T54_000959 [Emericellopsis cladophorae]|uniref:HMA domain-containing protein n=1 Tax=Emericellopsis cladophorae TaxID=2686198 RepID=A0A9P9Y3H7_9HYPO|nr:uncharacterized protein J7T54_000959 [Emericellopsis cladophorae]KAI6782816.1 hypothetical protein J7T54_000959 [Emericellopsis cladophorae]